MKKLRIVVFKLIDILVILTMVSASPMNLSAAAMAQESTPVLVTDQTDYSPGESARMTGSGFPAGGYVLAADSPEGSVDWGSVTVEEGGVFVTDSPALASAGTYAVRAYPAGWSGDWSETPVASASFTVTAPPPPTETPTEEPTEEPTEPPTAEPTEEPTIEPTEASTATSEPTGEPTDTATTEPTATSEPTAAPTSTILPTIESDKADYFPGELVILTGANWQGDTEVRIIVNDDVGQTWKRDVIVPVAGDGTIYDSFNLPAWFVATYFVTASGQQTGRVITYSFTDSPGSYNLDFSAADPGDVPTYPKLLASQLACPAPSGGTGRAADPLADAIFGNPNDSVESLAPEDMILGQIVPFETEIHVNGSTAPEDGRIKIVQTFLTKTTNGGNFGYDPTYGIYCAFIDTADSGNSTLAAGTKVESFSYTILDPGGSNERIEATIIVSGLVNPERAILETWVILKNSIPAGTTGNVQSSIGPAQTCTNAGCTSGGNINSGNQTVPLLRVQEFFTNDADVSITKSDDPDPVVAGSQLTYTINVTNNSAQNTANGIVVTDTLDPNTTFVSSSLGAACSAVGQVVTCNIGGLTPGQSTSFAITVDVSSTAPTAGTVQTGECTVGQNGVDLCNTVSVTALNDDPNTSNNSDTEPTNVLPLGGITINKVALGGDDTFSYTTSGGGLSNFDITTSGGSGSQSFTNLTPGTKSVTESAPPAGWDFTSLSCSDPDNGTTTSGQTANIDLDPGEAITCTFTNTKRGSIIVEKQTDIEGQDGLFTFTGTAAGTISDNGQIVVSNLAPGTYSSTESDPSPTFALTSIACDDGSSITPSTFDLATRTATFNLNPGETVKCTFTNTLQQGTLTVIKQVITNNGGTATADQWSIHVMSGGNDVGGSPQPGNTTGTNYSLTQGTYNVSESGGPSGYTFSGFSGDCDSNGDVTVVPGQTKTCTLTNDDQPGTLIVKKVVVNDNGGTLETDDFTFQVNGGSAIPFEADGQNNLTVNAGTYTVTEPAVAGYTTSYDNCADLVIPNGGSATCTITNNDQAATLIVKKIVINDNGGILEADDFSFQVNGGAVTAFEADGQNDLSVSAGTYTVTEPAVAGYTTTYDNCSNLIIPNGGSATCTITNNDQAAHLKLVKVVSNDNGGTAVATDFTLSASGPTSLSGAGGAESDVNAGTYTLSETSVPGYSASAWVCVGGTQNGSDITLANGQSATCTITNHDNAPSLELVKVVINDNGGSAETTDFILSANGPTPISGAGGASSDASFQTGTYTLSETGPGGYSASAWVCTGTGTQNGNQITLGLDQSAICTITNDDDIPSLTLVKQVINDNGGQAIAADFTLSADGPTPISGAGGATSDATFEAGTYDLSETTIPGYTASDWVCVGGTQDDEDTVTVGLGEDVTCTITNNDNAPSLTLVKVVVNDNGGTATEANFTLTATGPTGFAGPGPSVSNGASFDAGTYALSESGPAGYTASAWSCVGGTQNGSDITLGLGESAICTITNDDNAPSLTLVKVVVNDNGGTALVTDFNLSADGPTPITGAGGAASDATFDAGTYNLSETGPDGYTASDWVCSGGTQDDADTITLGLGESATCTITNDDQAPSLTLVKVVTNDDGGNAVESDWTLTATGPTGFSGIGPSVSNGASFDAGTYTLSESGPTGYAASAWSCVGGTQNGSDITLALGQSATCTITNDDVAPTLKLVKIVNNDNGGNAVADDWVLYAVASAPNNGRNFSNAGGSGVFETVYANTAYDLSESVVAGYTASSWSCNGGTLVGSTVTLAEGQTNITCTITNDDQAATLTLVKTVVNDDGGDAVIADFPLFINGDPVTSGVANTLSANILYTATETTQPGYTASAWGGDCAPDGTITLNEGQNAICTITNNDVAPTLKLFKNVITDNGGNAVADDWTLSADAAAPFDGRNFSNLGGSGVFETVFANAAYDLSESTVAGYTAGSWNCDGGTLVGSTVTLNEGETGVTCTITNDDSAPTLTLIKNVINDNGGNALPDDFSLTIGGNAALSGVTYTLSANTPYAINETLLSGYTFVDITGDADCPAVLGGTVTLDEGENVTCTITNDDVAPTLTLIKNVVNDNGGNAQPNDFNLTIGGNAATSGTAYPVSANTPYAIDETLLSGYSFVSITGDPECPAALGGTVTLDEGENVTCTITNDDQAATLIIIKHVINDNGGTADAGDFTLDSGGTDDTPDDFPGEEAPGTTVTLDAGAYNVTETGPSGYSASFSADCSGTIANGETKTCTVTNDDIQPQLIVIKHVINDNGGTADAADFTMEVSGNNVNPVNFAGSELGVNVALNAGSYSVGETGPAGYAPSFSADCTGSIAVGETRTCTITNDDISPTLTVVKVLLPGNDTGLFNLQIDGVTQAADVGDNGTTGAVAVNAGVVHTVGETAGTGTSLSDYVSTISGHCAPDGTVSLALAENKTCTITNVRRGSIVIVKSTLGGDGTFDFTSTSFGPFSLTTSGGTASTTFSGLDPANTYDVAETIPAGWELNTATCDSGETVDSIDLDPGETVTCTFENEKAGSIVIVKNTIGGEGTFDFTSTTLSNFSLTTTSNTASSTFSNLDVDLTYDVAETVPAGWDLTGATCNSGETIESINLDPGETVTCTFTNTKRATIIINKDAIPNDAQDFSFTATESTNTPIPDFTLDDDADATLPKTMTFTDLKPGDYTVTEALVAGWDLTGMSCASTVNLNSGVNVNINTATATINLGPGDTVVCTFSNTKRGHIIVDKVTNPAGDTQSFSFDASGGFSPVYTDFSLTDASAPNDQELSPGSYSVTETLPSGWDLESATCTSSIGDTETPGSIELDPGETVNCTFTNEKDAFIIVEKQTDPNADPTLFDFTTDYGPAFQLSDGQTNNSGDIDPGTYSVTETLPAGWDLESVTCSDGSDPSSISLQAGETVTCVFTNEKDAFIIVEKQTIPDGDSQVFDFDLSYGTGDADLSDGQTDNSGDLDPGTYSVSENVPSGWDLTSTVCSDGSSASSISLQAGEMVTCVFTNTKRGHIIVDKVTLPSADAQSFVFTTTGTGYTGFNLTDAASPNDQELVPGTYSVTETALTGWDLTGLSCTDPSGAPAIAGNKATINLAAGETVNCTFTNTKRGTITIVKDALPNDAQDFSFTSAALGNFSLDDDSNNTLSNTKTVINLVPGAYSVTEGAVAGWDLTGLTCDDANGTTNLGTRTASIALDPGENVTCTFTNTKRGTIIVEKQTNPNGAPGNFTFTGTAAGTIADNGTITVANLVPGTYTSTESDPAVTLFALTSIVCNDGSSANPSTGSLATRTATFKLDPGETVRCVFTNTKDFHAGTIGFWKNWRNHYTSAQSQLLINYLKSNNPKIYNKDLILNNSDDFTIAKWGAIFNLGSKTPREQMILAQFTALKLNLAITQLDGTGGLVQKNDDLCTSGVVDVSGISGATAFFGTSTPTVGQIVNAVENRWTGKLTTNRSDWKWSLTNAQKDMLIKVVSGINEGTLVMSSGCP